MLHRMILALVLLGVLAACQTASDDSPAADPDCKPRDYESGACG